MHIKWKTLIFSIALPLLAGALVGLIVGDGIRAFDSAVKPSLYPTGILFPIVWTVLYVLMGTASYLSLTSGARQDDISGALKAYGIQLFFNLLWPVMFFSFELYTFAFIWLLVMLGLIILTVIRFLKVSKAAAYLMLPYILWVSFAAYLNLGVAVLN